LFITKPINEPYILDYPELLKKFTGSGFKCPTDQEEALPPRQISRMSGNEMAMESARNVQRLLHDPLKHQTDVELMSKVDQVYELVSRLSGLQLEQVHELVSGLQREQTDDELMSKLDQIHKLMSRPQHQYQRQDQRQDRVSHKGEEVN
jgi:hypothetical protein